MASVKGDLPSILRNDEKLYEGNLVYYFKVAFNCAKNLQHPYHNFRHIFHVMWLCYSACQYYRNILTPRQMRNLLIAAIFHDFDHSGKPGHDELNIAEAIKALEKHIAPEDRAHLADISYLIRMTEFPYKISSDGLELRALIIRDADLSQAFSVAWIQQIVFGLASEWEKKPADILKLQGGFLGSLKFHTKWAEEKFPDALTQEKINEAKELLTLLEEDTAAAA